MKWVQSDISEAGIEPTVHFKSKKDITSLNLRHTLIWTNRNLINSEILKKRERDDITNAKFEGKKLRELNPIPKKTKNAKKMYLMIIIEPEQLDID